MRSTIRTITLGGLAAIAAAAPAGASGAPERVVRFADAVPAAAQHALVERAGGRVTRDLPIIDGLGARLTDEQARRLDADPRVLVQDNAPVAPAAAPDPEKLATAFNQSVAVDKLWQPDTDESLIGSLLQPTSDEDEYEGATGKGVTVAVIDTGIAGDLPDFRTSESDHGSRVIASAVVNPNATSSRDGFGHGTHVAGLIAGNGANRDAGDPLRGKYAGAAPDAALVSIKASDDEGGSTILDVINGLQFVVDHRDELGIRVVNLSLSSSAQQSYRTDPLDAAVEQAWLQGIVVVAAAGNRGDSPGAVSSAPANDPYALTVGAADDKGTKNLQDDVLAPWSSRGTTQDGFRKPEVIAPGARLTAPLAPGSVLARQCPSCLVGDKYLRIGGTSMSAGVASGAVATMLEVHPDWTPDMVKSALVATARAVGSGPMINAHRAVHAHQSGRVANVNAGLTPSDAIDASTGTLDWTKVSWTKVSWTSADEALRASWAKTSWTCADCAPSGDAVDPTKMSWTKTSWAKTSWTFAPAL